MNISTRINTGVVFLGKWEKFYNVLILILTRLTKSYYYDQALFKGFTILQIRRNKRNTATSM